MRRWRWRRGIKTLKRENNKNCGGGNKSIEKGNNKIVEKGLKQIEERNKIETGEG